MSGLIPRWPDVRQIELYRSVSIAAHNQGTGIYKMYVPTSARAGKDLVPETTTICMSL